MVDRPSPGAPGPSERLIGVATSRADLAACSTDLAALADLVADGIREAGGTAVRFDLPAVSDAAPAGSTPASLVLREVLADSVELVARAQGLDAVVAVAGCEASIPGMLMGALRLDLPVALTYGGPDGTLDAAATTACATEALGLALAGSTPRVPGDRTGTLARATGEAAVRAAERGLRPSALLTEASFENALATVAALGGSTSTLLHLLALAFEADLELDLDDVDRVCRRTPHLGPGREVPELLAELSSAELVDGSARTIEDGTLTERLSGIQVESRRPDPAVRTSVVQGTLAPDGAIARTTGTGSFRGPARVLDSEDACVRALSSGAVRSGDVLVVRYEGPQGGPGMRELLAVSSALVRSGLGPSVALVTDGRVGPDTGGPMVGHVAPETFEGGPIAAVEDGDPVTIDAEAGRLDLEVPEELLWERLEHWFPPVPRYATGALAKYAKLVKSASRGAVCY